MENSNAALSKLSEEQLASLNDELKAVFCMLDETDQKFFASTFKPKDLPGVLTKKAEIMKRNRASDERLQQIKASFASLAPASTASNNEDDLLAAAATALGIGAAATMVATDNTAFYQGVEPAQLVAPLQTEFQSSGTAFSCSGQGAALVAAVYLVKNAERIPAMTVNLTKVNDGTEVKVNDLTTQGVLETVKSGGQKLLNMAEQGLALLNIGRRPGISPDEVIQRANQALSSGADLAKDANNLRLKERAWKVVRGTAESIEEQYKAEVEQARQRRLALEQAWDRYYNCPTCAVPFGDGETQCRVCGTARPEAPQAPDPRKQ
jgi:hypothetical protein